MRKLKTAIIIKGNPKNISDNQLAKEFYSTLKSFLEELGYSVTFDAGEAFTKPLKADVWIGHSRGADRLRLAPKGVKTIAIGSYQEGAINHNRDNTIVSVGPSDTPANKYHYTLSLGMKDQIRNILGA